MAQSVTVKSPDCGFDPHSKRLNIYLRLYFYIFALVSRQSSALSYGTQHAMSPEFGGKWGTVCLTLGLPENNVKIFFSEAWSVAHFLNVGIPMNSG